MEDLGPLDPLFGLISQHIDYDFTFEKVNKPGIKQIICFETFLTIFVFFLFFFLTTSKVIVFLIITQLFLEDNYHGDDKSYSYIIFKYLLERKFKIRVLIIF